MKKLNKNQIDQFLNITKEVTASADHIEISIYGNFWDDTVVTVTITTSMTTTGIAV